MNVVTTEMALTWKYALIFASVLLYKCQVCYTGCPRATDELTVALMCRNSYASGKVVYIDTSAAKATDNSTGILCSCNATISGKLVEISASGNSSVCGSNLTFHSSKANTSLVTKDCVLLPETIEASMVEITLQKTQPTYIVDYCATLTLKLCDNGQYQCNGLVHHCISNTSLCDHNPDCAKDDDEIDCEKVCSEGENLCNDGQTCYGESQKCDNVSQCGDNTDELNCYSGNVTEAKNDISVPAGPVEPIIFIQCYESTRFSKTTSTSTKTTTTTTTTPTTTTAIPTTTSTATTTTTTTTPVSITITPNTTTSLTTDTPTHTIAVPLTAILPLTTSATVTAELANTATAKNVSVIDTNADHVSTVKQPSYHTTHGYTKPEQHENPDRTGNLITNPWVISGIVVGALLLVGLLAISFVFAARRHSRNSL